MNPMLTVMLGAIAAQVPEFPALSDEEVIAAWDGPYEDEATIEMRDRLRRYPASWQNPLVLRLVDAADHASSNKQRFGASEVLLSAAEGGVIDNSPSSPVLAHVRRVLQQSTAKDAASVARYLNFVTDMKSDRSPETFAAVNSVMRNAPLMYAHNMGVDDAAMRAMSSFGADGETGLLERFPVAPYSTATWLGRTGGARSYDVLLACATTNQWWHIRGECTNALSIWGETKPVGSPERAAAEQALRSLACGGDRSVPDQAQLGLKRLKVAPEVCPTGSSLTELSPTHLWLGLKNSDDQGTRFDLRTELLINGTPVATGLTRCITGVTRNQSNALESTVNWPQFESRALQPTDVVTLRVSTRIGTNADDTFCGGHSNAVGLRVYYDSATRPARFGITVTPAASANHYLHSNGTSCGSSGSTGVTSLTTDTTAPTGTSARCRDSGSLRFSGGNAWVVVDSWTVPAVQ